MCVSVCERVHVCLCRCLKVCVGMCVSMCVCLCIYIYVCVCVCVCVCSYTHIHIYTYILQPKVDKIHEAKECMKTGACYSDLLGGTDEPCQL